MKSVTLFRTLLFVAACAAFSLPASAETVGGGAPAPLAPPETVGGGSPQSSNTAPPETVGGGASLTGDTAPPETVGGGDALLAWFKVFLAI